MLTARRLCALLLPLGLAFVPLKPAAACGCFTPPDATTPLVQAGERILFVQENGQTTAHIQIQYAGRPADFGWLLPLPAVPKNRLGEPGVELGVDDVFTQLVRRTQPRYQIARIQRESCGEPSSAPAIGCGYAASDAAGSPTISDGGANADLAAPNPLVATNSVGPYHFAILQADSKDAMLKWLADNRYFVPAGTESAVAPYIRPGAFFLALKLRAGQSSGDLQPVVVRYKADLPMIPIVLTAVGATPNMGIQVWLLGRGRGIPRNYHHVVLNDGQIDWFTAQNYNDVVVRAVREAPERHAFVTEYAGTSDLMRGALLPNGRYSDSQLFALSGQKDPVLFVGNLPSSGFSFGSQLFAVLGRHIPMPKALVDEGVRPEEYYQQLGLYLRDDRRRNPGRYADIEAALIAFDPAAAMKDLRDRIVTPTREADALFVQHPYLTRLYTTLSPEDMTKDPVFGTNPSLPDVPLLHQGAGFVHCDGAFTLTTELQAVVKLPRQGQWRAPSTPFARRIEVLRETGAPEVVIDHGEKLGAAATLDKMGATSGCAAGKGRGLAIGRGTCLLVAGLLSMWLLLRLRERRPFDSRRVSG